MRRRGLQLRRWHRWLLYGVSLSLFSSGILWAWINHLDEAGRAADWLVNCKQPLIAVHGLSAMIFVLLFGTILHGHARRSWHAAKNLNNGVFFLASVGLLTLSGYVLYYLGNENWRAAAANIHLWLGAAAPVLLLLHIRLGRRAVTRDTIKEIHRPDCSGSHGSP